MGFEQVLGDSIATAEGQLVAGKRAALAAHINQACLSRQMRHHLAQPWAVFRVRLAPSAHAPWHPSPSPSLPMLPRLVPEHPAGLAGSPQPSSCPAAPPGCFAVAVPAPAHCHSGRSDRRSASTRTAADARSIAMPLSGRTASRVAEGSNSLAQRRIAPAGPANFTTPNPRAFVGAGDNRPLGAWGEQWQWRQCV